MKDYIFEEARIWLDPLDKEAWYVIARTHGHGIMLGLKGIFSSHRSSEELWNVQPFPAVYGNMFDWANPSSMRLGTLDGLPCLIVDRMTFKRNVGICFLDPKTMVDIRRPLFIQDFAGNMTIVAERWLVVTKLQDREEIKNRIAVWDLDSDENKPIGSWLQERGDMLSPIVIEENQDSFQTLQVLPSFVQTLNEQICRFHWP